MYKKLIFTKFKTHVHNLSFYTMNVRIYIQYIYIYIYNYEKQK